ncbi:MAG: hypothetical protein HGA79_08040, partial [Anaerolineales bacterium]|nr:hypothetical protein [Anaerolineales bacterium]
MMLIDQTRGKVKLIIAGGSYDKMGNITSLIRYENGSELSDMPAIYRLPNAPDWFAGVANLHGLLVPVFDLASYLGTQHLAA